MRIFFDGRVLINTGVFSGISEYARILLGNLLENDSKNEYIIFLNSFRKNLEISKQFSSNRSKTINYHIPNRLLDITSNLLNFPAIDKTVKADVFYSPHLNILSFKNPKRRVLTIHDLSFMYFPKFFSVAQKLWHMRQSYESQIKSAGKIIAVSDFTAWNIAETFNIPKENIKRIYSGINPIYKIIPKNNEELKKFSYSKGLNNPFLLYLGALEPRKNIIGVIKAFNLLKTKTRFGDLKLVIAGGKGWLYDKIFKEAATSSYKKDILFWGKASPKEALYLYNLASVFVYPSFFEGFGFPPLEAQACGLPVVASNRSSLPEILGNSALLSDPYKTDELAMGIETVLVDTAMREELKDKGLENIKRFSWKNTAQELIKIFNEYA
ncbi:MAG: glycosyltransferase family 1 protein [Patescibacteria group bacterium]